MNNKKGQPEILATQTNSNVSPYIANNNIQSIKKQDNSRQKHKQFIEEARSQWIQKEQSLHRKKIEQGHGELSFDEILALSIDGTGQAEADKLLSFQAEIKNLQTEWTELWPEDAVVEELNKRHAMIHEGKTQYLTEKMDEKTKTTSFSFENRQSLIDFYENQIIETSEGELKSKAKIWLTHPKKRAFDGIVFNPKTLGHNRCYNIWRGFAVKPHDPNNPKKGSCDLFKYHIKQVICNGNEEHFSYVWKWLAHLVQHPDKIGTALLLMGLQGIGKGIFVKAIMKLFGPHAIHLDNLDHVVGNFNFHLRMAVLVFCDEAIWGGNKKDIGRVKAMITEETAIIEPKGQNSYELPNFRHFIFSSNESWPVHLDRDDRRFLVLRVNEEHKDDFEYFEKILEELKNGGYEALLYELLHVDLTDFRIQALPKNTDNHDVKLESGPSAYRYIFNVLSFGSFDIGNATPQEEWKEEKRTDFIYADYRTWCERNTSKPLGDDAFGRILKEILPSVEKVRQRKEGIRQYIYKFPKLDVARAEYQKSFKVGADVWD